MNKKMNAWLRAASIRSIKTMSQTAVAMIGTSAIISDVQWSMVVSASILSGVLSILTSIAGLPEVNEKNESILFTDIADMDEETLKKAEEVYRKLMSDLSKGGDVE